MLSPIDFFDRVAALKREGQPFAVATVVARRPPVSAHLGDRAIVFADGRMDGFVGGACSREIVRKQALEALKARTARLVSIRPDPNDVSEPEPPGPWHACTGLRARRRRVSAPGALPSSHRTDSRGRFPA